MKKLKLPTSCVGLLEQHGVSKSSIIHWVLSDLNKDGEYNDTYLIITKEKLILIHTPIRDKKLHYSAGFERTETFYSEGELTLTSYDLSSISELKVQQYVTNGCLLIIIDEKEQHFISFTNSITPSMKQVEQVVKEIKSDTFTTLKESNEEHNVCPTCHKLYPDKNRKICPKCMNKSSIFIRTLKYFLPYKIRISLMMISYIVVAALGVVSPYLTGTVLFDKILSKNDSFLNTLNIPGITFAYALVILVFTIFISKFISQCFGILQGYLTAGIVPNVVKNLRTDVFDSLSKLSLNFFLDKQTGSLMTRVIHDASNVTAFFIDGLPYIFVNILTVIFTCVIMFRMNVKLAIASLCLLPLLFIISFILLPILWGLFDKRHKAMRRLNSQINDNLTGTRVVKAFGKEEKEVERFSSYNKNIRTSELNITSFDNKFFLLYASVDNISKFAVWGIGAYLVLVRNEIPFGVLMTFVTYVGQLRGPLDFFSYAFRWWSDSINNASRIFEILDAVPDITEVESPVVLDEPKGVISFDSVTFGYEAHEPVLKNVSFQVEAGKMLGIVGKSGAGKSTLVNLISRLYEPQEGSITLDGIPIKDLSFDSLHKNIAMVSQETYIFIGSVAENIAYAKPDATKKEVILAAMKASAHDFITKMPDGYDTIIGSSGRSLSGGERQRISIARAILANPKILILDEATASVDTETEQAIQASLEKLVQGRTTLSIAHRLSTLRSADSLIVIDEGKVTESGTHEELIKNQSTYYKLMELQTKALALKVVE